MLDRLIQRDKDPDGDGGSATIESDHYIHDGEEQVFHTGSTVAYGSHVYMTGPIKDLVLFDQTDVLYAYLGDHLNTVRDVLEHNGSAWVIDNHVVYDSFGNRTETGGATISPFLGFTGRPFDKDTGLQYNWHRWYDAGAGRWMSEDPINFLGGDANIARYVSNSPLHFSDPTGLVQIGGRGSIYATEPKPTEESLEKWRRWHANPVHQGPEPQIEYKGTTLLARIDYKWTMEVDCKPGNNAHHGQAQLTYWNVFGRFDTFKLLGFGYESEAEIEATGTIKDCPKGLPGSAMDVTITVWARQNLVFEPSIGIDIGPVDADIDINVKLVKQGKKYADSTTYEVNCCCDPNGGYQTPW